MGHHILHLTIGHRPPLNTDFLVIHHHQASGLGFARFKNRPDESALEIRGLEEEEGEVVRGGEERLEPKTIELKVIQSTEPQ